MKKLLLVNLLMIFILGSATAQNVFSAKAKNYSAATLHNDTLKILAVMVEFQEDRDAATFGNGKFGTIYSKEYGNSIIDPLPHDANYFENHLLFVKNYFQKASKGKQNISYQVLPQIVTVTERMRIYSPENDEVTPLANLAKESWNLAKQIHPDVNYNSYDVFIIFHAGVGKDLSLPGSLGNEKDLPSIYLSNKVLRENLTDISGLPENRSGEINSVIIPETESRELSNFGETALLELSINGILVANIASHLGLPDLFDTETGLSAIGRFGLMDGQAIFAYNGVFPPEPSAWEKIYLGWVEPVTSNLDSGIINLKTSQIANLSDTVIYKIPISSTEYYLVENRNRDALKNGAVISSVMGNETINFNFEKDTTGFYSYSIDSLAGVITDVDEFDWALPGSGILIWHIDEKIIQNKLAENKINADKNNRGVDIEEADGIQDIGENFYTIFGEQVIGEGDQFDLWHKNNNSNLYKNKFDNSTTPNTKTNSGANSLISFSDFSAIENTMTFKLNFGSDFIEIIQNKNLGIQDSIISFNYLEKENLFSVTGKNTFYLFDDSLKQIFTLQNFSNEKPAIFDAGDTIFISGVYDNNFNLIKIFNKQVFQNSFLLNDKITSPPIVIAENNGAYRFFTGTANGKIYVILNEEINEIESSESFPPVKKLSGNFSNISVLFANDEKSFIKQLMSNNITEFNENIVDIASFENSKGYFVVALSNENEIFVIQGNEIANSFKLNSSSKIERIALSDFSGDGNPAIIFSDENQLKAVNISGAILNNFPFTADVKISEFVLTGEFENSSNIIFSDEAGNIYFVNEEGKISNGLKISSGAELKTSPVLFNKNGSVNLAAITENNDLLLWNLKAQSEVEWSQQNADEKNSSFIKINSEIQISENLLPNDKVYNWPNPVYGTETFIRCFVAEDSKINIRIFDLAGDFVTEMNHYAKGGFDNEYVWNVSQIQSGVYFARVEAESNSGKSELKVIKIAVIK